MIGQNEDNWDTLNRFVETVEGPVRVKKVTGWGVERQKAEYEDLAKIAREHDISLTQAAQLLQK